MVNTSINITRAIFCFQSLRRRGVKLLLNVKIIGASMAEAI